MTTEHKAPRYTGMVKYTSEQGGYALWLPSGWHQFEMGNGRQGMIFSPSPGLPAPAFSVEKTKLPFKVSAKDLAVLKDGFRRGLESLPGAKIESQEEIVEEKILALDARLIFLDQEQLKRRWIRVVYSGEAQLTLIAEGAPPEEFDYWLPMFYNIMMTMTI